MPFVRAVVGHGEENIRSDEAEVVADAKGKAEALYYTTLEVCPVLSCPVLSCPVLPCSRLVLSCLASSRSPRLDLSGPVLSCPSLFCHVLACLLLCYQSSERHTSVTEDHRPLTQKPNSNR